MSEARLLRRARAGDRRALDRLLRRELPAIRRAVRAVLGVDSELDDVTQQALIEAVRSLDSFREESRLSTWLVRIAIRTAWAHIRLRRKVVRLDSAVERRAVAECPPTRARSEALCELRRLQDCLGELPTDQRVVFLMHDVEGFTTREISETLEIPPGTVSTRLRAARSRVRKALRPPGRPIQRARSTADESQR